ncbi:lipid-A-disaccharide synthase [Pseudodesulfovibrio sp.]|uniref:lipid-A-disaccharide synthase n=1 Tax=Pseudodesulfovibrio sp. TaxID=2035812 RepID=UPI0026088668|nr:lipid-A-disaccharide synthase [Pseudodesulfovibrio sp.]MDD3311786.1 lipid-A-disaccharide synthase [Pseudodesulfovibrio sp.]
MPGNIWINCSEASGDMYAGALAGELLRLDPQLEIGGLGGRMLALGGAKVHFPMTRLCFAGFIDVLRGLPGIFRLHREIVRAWKRSRPDVVVMIDCPDFNLPLAKAAHAMGIPVLYFIAPQFWAWKQQGLNTLRRCVRSTLCALPFEPSFLRGKGCRSAYGGHPLLDVIPLQRLDRITPDRYQVGIMPGSRKKEVAFLLPEFAEAAARLHREMPWIFFSIARAPGISRRYLRRFWPDGVPAVIVEPDERFEMIRRSGMVLAASGTATLETGLIGTPTIVAYKIDPPAAYLLRRLATSKWISLTNILFREELFPEYLQERATADNCHAQMAAWLNDPGMLLNIRNKLQELRRIAGPSGGIRFAAETILAQRKGERQ